MRPDVAQSLLGSFIHLAWLWAIAFLIDYVMWSATGTPRDPWSAVMAITGGACFAQIIFPRK